MQGPARRDVEAQKEAELQVPGLAKPTRAG